MSNFPLGHIAYAITGYAANIGMSVARAYRNDAIRQRRIWNYFLALNIEKFQQTKKFVFYHEMAKILTNLRKTDEWIGGGGVATQQQTLMALDRALKDAFSKNKKQKGFPRFKSARQKKDVIRLPADSLRKMETDGIITHIAAPKLPSLRVRGLRKLPEGHRLTQLTIREDSFGWHISINVVGPAINQYNDAPDEEIGIDLGLTHLAILSNGEKISNPRHTNKAAKKLKHAQRCLSRRIKGSKRKEMARKRVARIHGGIARARKSYLHRITSQLISKYRGFAVEDLCIKGLVKTRMAKSISDAAWSEFIRQLEYKSQWYGRSFARHPRFERSTGVCPDCGVIGPKLDLSIREWKCGSCGITHDRDVAAARIILLNSVGQQMPEPVCTDVQQNAQLCQLAEGNVFDISRCVGSLRISPIDVKLLTE
jgi:putative transposase